ncbi:MAG: phosphoglucomutase/phosphomannomutase family protein [Firmicutes bacterium]|nr:phosphoglucomutase/phosphomannomutase family protein [Bacillota bacterium]
MTSRIKFGTDGWRGVIARDFTFDNVNRVAEAIAIYINQQNLGSRGVVVGYDNRFLSKEFAEEVSEVMLSRGIPVYFSEKPIPTPVTAFAIKFYRTSGAVMITASHNPPQHNGIKYIPEYAGPALPYITESIENILKMIIDNKNGDYSGEKCTVNKEVSLQKFNIDNIYLEHIKKIIPFEKMKKNKLKVIIDPMHGAGIGYLREIAGDLGWDLMEINDRPDPLFGGNLPEPTKDRLHALREWVIKSNANFGMALDGDADRFGIIDSDGTYICPNEVLYILLNYLLNKRGWRGAVARTVATTHVLDEIAKKHNLELIETPVGFKYIGECLMKKGAILGGEESGGLSIKGHIPEKDGILANALMMEIASLERKNFREIIRDIQAQFGRKVSGRLDVRCSEEKKIEVIGKLNSFSPEALQDKKVVRRITIDGLKLVMEDGSWCLIRPSGTETLFRIYAEAGDEVMVENVQQEVREMLGL